MSAPAYNPDTGLVVEVQTPGRKRRWRFVTNDMKGLGELRKSPRSAAADGRRHDDEVRSGSPR